MVPISRRMHAGALGVVPLIAAVLVFLAPVVGISAGADEYQAETFQGKGGKTLPYRFLKPRDYDKSKHYPLVLFFSWLWRKRH